jgi:hypothetical protein
MRKKVWTVLEIMDPARPLMPTQSNVIIFLDDSQHDEAQLRLPEYQFDIAWQISTKMSSSDLVIFHPG